MRADLLGLDFPAFAAWLGGEVGHDAGFHRAGYRYLFATGRWDPAAVPAWCASASPGLIARLAALATPAQAPAPGASCSGDDGTYGITTRMVIPLADGREVESVSIPMAHDGHRTVCVSSQVGCRMGCAFCRTARMGLVRNLAAHEIVGQIVAVALAGGRWPRNLAFMGMGEPLDNIAAVAQAVRVATDRCGLGLAWKHVTISTVGRCAGLAALAGHGLHRANLALSLHAADDAVRSALVPPARCEPVAEIRRALAAVPLPRGRRIMVSVVVIPGVTDAPGLLRALAQWCAGLPVQVNLIPFNPFPGCDPAWRAPLVAEMGAAHATLRDCGVEARKRVTKGAEVLAACGQLATRSGRRG